MDETDQQILDMLQDNGRASYREISEAVEVTPPTVKSRVDDMKEQGIIQGFTVEVDKSRITEGTLLEGLLYLSSDPEIDSEINDQTYQTMDGETILKISGTKNQIKELINEIPNEIGHQFELLA